MARGKDKAPRKPRKKPTPEQWAITLAKRAANREAKKAAAGGGGSRAPPADGRKKPTTRKPTGKRKTVTRYLRDTPPPASPKTPPPKRRRLRRITGRPALSDEARRINDEKLAATLAAGAGTILRPRAPRPPIRIPPTPPPAPPTPPAPPPHPSTPPAPPIPPFRPRIRQRALIPIETINDVKVFPLASKALPTIMADLALIHNWIPRMNKEIKDNEKDLDDCRTDYAELTASDQEMKKKLKDCEKDMRTATKDYDLLETYTDKTEEELKDCKKEVVKLHDDIRAHRTEYKARTKDASDAEDKAREFQTELKNTKAQLANAVKYVSTAGTLGFKKAQELKKCEDEVKRSVQREIKLQDEKKALARKLGGARSTLLDVLKQLPKGKGAEILKERTEKEMKASVLKAMAQTGRHSRLNQPPG